MDNLKEKFGYEISVLSIGKYYSVDMMRDVVLTMLDESFKYLHKEIDWVLEHSGDYGWEMVFENSCHKITGIIMLAKTLGIFSDHDCGVYNKMLRESRIIVESCKKKYHKM